MTLCRAGWLAFGVTPVLLCSFAGGSAQAVDSTTPQKPKGEERKCTYEPAPLRSSKTVKPTVKLSPDQGAQIVNFGGERGWKFVDVVLNATPPLPAWMRRSDIRLAVVRRFTRVEPNLPTRYAPLPKFTTPVFSPGRDRVTFTICLDSTGLAAGAYTGSVLVEGPTGLGPVSLGVTENLKNSDLALWLALGSLFAAFFFLLVRGAAARQAKAAEKHGHALANTADKAESVQTEALRRAPPAKDHIHSYFTEVLLDLNWWLTTVVALGVAAGSIIAIYSTNPSWGADLWGSVAGIVGPTFAAVGVQSVVTSLGKSTSG
jgi:hypothetical protein